MAKKQIVFLDGFRIDGSQLDRLKPLTNITRSPKDWPDKKESVQLARNAHILVSKWVHVTSDILKASPDLQYVVMAMTGYHGWIDIETAKKLNIKVSNCPGFSSQAVAEHTILLMLAVLRKLFQVNSDLKKGVFNPKSYMGAELKGKTLGIVGYGNIGRTLAGLAKGFGMKIKYVNSQSSKEERNKLLKACDILSLNVPHTPQTENLIGENELMLLKKGAVVINTSRGKVVDEKALIKHLKN